MESCLLSICIPTYNRLWKLSKQVNDLLSVADDRFNIVVSDNNSTDGTKEYLFSLSSNKRVRALYQEGVSSAQNIANAISSANGTFSMLLLDKDSIDISGLQLFLDTLEKTSAKVGFCKLDQNDNGNASCLLLKPNNNLVSIAYLCRHPSGYFYNSEIARKEMIQCSTLVEQEFPFTWDVVFTHMASRYDALIYSFPFMYSETDQEGTVIKSLTYNISNLWFAPNKVVSRYLCFLKDLDSLLISNTIKSHIRIRLFHHCFRVATIGYSSVLSNPELCIHYGISCKQIPYNELLLYSKEVLKSLRNHGYNGLLLFLLYGYNKISILLYHIKRR